MLTNTKIAPMVRSGLTGGALPTALLVVSLTVLATPAHAQTGSGFFDAIYVPNRDSDSVSVIDLDTNTVVETIFLGAFSGRTAGVALEDATKLYITQQYRNSVAVIDTSTNTVIKEIPVGLVPLDLTISPDSTTVYVSSFVSDQVHAIDTATMTIVDSVSLPGGTPVSVAFNDLGDTAWIVSHRQDVWGVIDVVHKIDTATRAILAEHNSGTDPNIGRGAAEVTVDDKGTAFVSNIGETEAFTFRPLPPHPDYITQIDGKGNTSTIQTGGLAPVGIITDFEGTNLFVSNAASNDVSILTRGKKGHTITAVVPVGNFPVTPVTFGKPLRTGPPPAGPGGEISFATFTKTKFEIHGKKRKIDFDEQFTLGAGSDGFDPDTEAVFVSFDALWYELPAGSMSLKKGKWSFQGKVTATNLKITIQDKGGGVWEIKVDANPTHLPFIEDPSLVLVRIGDDHGTTSWSPTPA